MTDAIDAALDASAIAFKAWRRSPAHERAALLRAARTQLLARRDEFASLIVEEAGKPVKLARAEIDRALHVLDWAASESLRYSGELLRLDTVSGGDNGFGIHQRFPRGPVLGITPFNFPLNLVLHKIAPAVASGCSILIKPSPHTVRTARAAAALFADAPASLVQCVEADDAQTARMTADARISTISFTGSAKVGWMIRAQAPRKPTILELGGNAWLIVTEDLDRSRFHETAVKIAGAAYGYAGQSCISVQNIAVSRAISSDFTAAMKEATRDFSWGDPSSEDVLGGPVIDSAAATRIEAAVSAAAGELGDEAVTRGSEPSGELGKHPGRWVRPALLELPARLSKATARLANEEVFGPVVTLRAYDELSEAIGWINQSAYGLQAGVYSDRLSVVELLYRELEVGGLVVNDVPTTRYDHQPYGGIKQSGLGREGIRYAMDELTESKFLALSPQAD